MNRQAKVRMTQFHPLCNNANDKWNVRDRGNFQTNGGSFMLTLLQCLTMREGGKKAFEESQWTTHGK